MIKTKKQMIISISAFILVLMLTTVTFAFFNYTRTGTANVIRTGRISFNSIQGEAINLTNMFPIDVSGGIPNDATKVGNVTINVTGDTTYTEGLEYLVTAVNVSNSVGNKSLPISIDVSVVNNTTNDPATTLGTVDADYYDNRGGNTSIYKVLANDTISNDDSLVVGYIAPGATGVDGNIVIRAYLDASRIAISDTYGGNETDNMGTTTTWVDDRTVFTTTEWNALQTNGISFKIKVESNEGIWVTQKSTFTFFDVGSIVNTKLKLLAQNQEYSNQNLTSEADYTVYKLIRSNSLPNTDSFTNTNILSSPNSKEIIYAWAEEYNSEHKIVYWYSNSNIVYLNEDSSYMFASLRVLDIADYDDFDTSHVQNMSNLFYDTVIVNFSKLELWNVSNVTNMSSMFYNVFNGDSGGSSTYINNYHSNDGSLLNNWDISNVTNFDNMFAIDKNMLEMYGESLGSFIYPTFTLRPGTWDNSIIQINGRNFYSGTYVPNN